MLNLKFLLIVVLLGMTPILSLPLENSAHTVRPAINDMSRKLPGSGGDRNHAIQPRTGESFVVADEDQLIGKEDLKQLWIGLAFLEWAVRAEE